MADEKVDRKALDAVLSKMEDAKEDEAFRAWKAAEKRVETLKRERRELQEEIEEIERNAIPGARISGRMVVEGRQSTPLDVWRRKNERKAEVRALVEAEGSENLEEQPLDRLEDLRERADMLDEAVGLGKERAKELHGGARRVVHEALAEMHAAKVVKPMAAAMKRVGELAATDQLIREKLDRMGFSRTTVGPGVHKVAEYDLRRPRGRSSLFVDDAEDWGP